MDENSINRTILVEGTVPYDNVFIPKALRIEGEKKEAILRELEEYGITEAFVYPDYEHQMKYVKDSIARKHSEWELDV